MNSSGKKVEEAFAILARYERSMVEKMAAEIVERREDFENPFVGGAEQLIENYQQILCSRSRVRSCLYGYLPEGERRSRPSDSAPLGKDEFRCFRCRSVIAADADACPKCGWNWG